MPSSIATRSVYSDGYLAPDLVTPVAGQLRFIPSSTVYDTTGNIVVAPLPLFAALDPTDGSFAIDLMVTDDPDANPQGWVWLVTEMIPNGREFAISIPSTAPSSVPISSLPPVIDVDLTFAYASLAAVYAALASVAATDASLRADVSAVEVDLNARMDLIDLSAAVVTAAVVIHPFLTMGA